MEDIFSAMTIRHFAMKDLNVLRMADEIRNDKARMDAARELAKEYSDGYAALSTLSDWSA